LDRTQALKLLKEIATSCPQIDEKTVSLKEADSTELTSKGLQIIVGGINKDNKTCIRKTVDQYNYLVKEGTDRIIIYEPTELKCPECGIIFSSIQKLKKHVTNTHYSKEGEQTEMPTGIM
jgi:hypothetical protein